MPSEQLATARPTSGGSSMRPAVYFPTADGFRALAIFTVFLEHLDLAAPSLPGKFGIAEILKPFDGVTMLFVLSAFLLSGPFLKAYFADKRPFPKVGSYFFARFLRIYPLYIVAVIAISAYEFLRHVRIRGWDVLSHVAFLQNASTATTQTISGPLWTMAVDVQFYLFLPFVFWALYVCSRDRSFSDRQRILGATLAVIVLASIVYRYAAVLAYHPKTLEAGIVYVRQLPGMLCVFAVGIGARAIVQTASERFRRTISRAAWATIVLALVLEPVCLVLHAYRLHALSHGKFFAAASMWSLADTLGAFACALLVLAVNFSPSNGLARLLSTRFFAFAATLSYAFYLFHLTVLQALIGSARPSWWLFMKTGSLAVLILVPLCYLLYRGIENPFLTLKSHLRRDGSAVVPDVSEMRHDRFEQVG